MWVAIRLGLAILGFLIRQLSRRRRARIDGHFEGLPYFESVDESKGRIQGFTIGTARRSPTWVRLHAESALDRWFKRVGIANECQTGDAAFDETVYVASDHPHIAAVLGEEAELREVIRSAIAQGYSRVQFDGTSISMQRDASRRPNENDRQLLQRIHAASARFEDEVPRRFADPFLWRAFAIEGAIWSLFGYAAGTVLEGLVEAADIHVHGGDLVRLGLLVAAVALACFLALIVAWMRGSSRGHRVIVESAVVLLVSLPVASIQAVGDTNRALDEAPSITTARILDHCEVREHRGRRGRRWYTHHLWLRPTREADALALPQTIEVTRSLCDASGSGVSVEFEIGPGRWGLEWYRRIRVGHASWTAPR